MAEGVTTYEWTGQAYGENGYEPRTYTVDGPLYHGGRRIRGDELKTGMRTNGWGDDGIVSQFIHFTTRLDTAAEYARRIYGEVYEVEPTGAFRLGYNGDEYKSEHPLKVLRRLAREEWAS